jgi:hypothetical protein
MSTPGQCRCGKRIRFRQLRCWTCVAKSKCRDCGTWVLRPTRAHRCLKTYEVQAAGTRSRRVRAQDSSDAAVAVVEQLERGGRFALGSGETAIVLVRRHSDTEHFPWDEVTITAVAMTRYYATRVQGARR